MTIYYQDETITLHQGDSLEVVRTLEPGSIDCIVTSPPYYGLRDYGSDGQYGLEETPAAYVETMRGLFSELRRVLADDGTLWLNLGDSYSKAGHLLGIPWRVAMALQDDGWILRNSIIWQKPNAMPESVADRLSGRHENLFMLAKSRRYWFDLDPIREELSTDRAPSRKARKPVAGWKENSAPAAYSGESATGKNPGDVWSINTQPFGGAHFAVMPQELARRAIVSGCKPGGTVLDPFSGSGTTGLVAQNNGRRYVGIDLSADYLRLSLETRLQNAALDFGATA
jgi:DNA modification methylase